MRVSRKIDRGTRAVQKSRTLSAIAFVALAAGCADPEVILRGERLPLRATQSTIASLPQENVEAPALDTSFEAPAATNNANWTHVGGSATHRADHPVFTSTPTLIWSTGIGQGNSRKNRLTADPVVADGRVFVVDSKNLVSAVSTAGAKLWSRNLTPPEEREGQASSGGLAVAGDTVYATTGFGEVIAMNVETGAEKWRQVLDAPATASPTVSGGLVYVVSRDNRAWGIDAGNGRVKWQLPGTPDVSGVLGGAAPAVNDRVAVFPFGSGELVAVLRQGGVRLWGSAVSGKRKGAAYANITDITADPVIVGDVIYTGSQSGRAVAMSLNSGERIWTARDGASGPVSVVGNSVFMISDRNELIRLEASSGEKVWGTELPFFRREVAKRAKAIFAHHGPVLAGGRLWAASDSGTLTSFDPATGAEIASFDVPGGAASSMAVAGGTMYVLSGRGNLLAFR